jgi:hypothetical protein
MEITNESFINIILELVERGYYKAGKELSRVYLTHQNNSLIVGMLARCHFQLHEYKECLNILDLSLKTIDKDDPDYESIQNNRAKCLYYLKNSPESIKILESFSEESKNTDDIKIDLALYKNSIGKFDESYEILKSVKQTHATVFNSGWHLFRKGKFKEAFENIIVGTKIKVWGNEWELKEKFNVGEELRWVPREKVDILAFYLEGGFGDEMIFLRYLEHFKPYCNKIKIFTSAKMVNMLIECGYKNVFRHSDITNEKWDKFVPSMSSPYYLQLDHPQQGVKFPYLVRDSNPVEELNKVSKGKKKILIKWKGNPEFEHDQFRTFPVSGLLKLDKFGQLFSIQIENDEDLKKNDNVWNLSHLIDSWSDTYDIINESDLLVTSCSSVAHLAGSMGKKVIVLVPFIPYYVWSSDDIKWYPENVTVIRQKEYDNWDSAFEELFEKVNQILN